MTLINRFCFLLPAILLAALPAYSQVLMTGAINFSTNFTGAASGGQTWNTLGGQNGYDLWLAREADAALPINGPADDQAGINILLQAGQSYKFYIFGQPGDSTGFNGLNLFFGGNDATPEISAFGATDSHSFSVDSNNTYTLALGTVAGSGRTFYSSNGATAVLTGYEWNAPLPTSPDVCQAYEFAPGDGPDFFGSFTLKVYPAAALIVSPGTGAPGTAITIAGSGFTPLEQVEIYIQNLGLLPRYRATTDVTGAFSVTELEEQAPYGYEEYFAVGQTSGRLGTAAAFVSPRVLLYPDAGVPGSTTNAQGVGFGAGETVQIYWNEPRQLLGTVIANSHGSFVSKDGVRIIVPLNAPIGINGVIGVGETTKALGLGAFTVE